MTAPHPLIVACKAEEIARSIRARPQDTVPEDVSPALAAKVAQFLLEDEEARKGALRRLQAALAGQTDDASVRASRLLGRLGQ